MPDPSTSQFLQNLRASGLLEEDQLRQIEQLADTEPKSDRSLARHLVREGLLTKYQAEKILAGRSQGFAIGPYTIIDRIGAGGMGKVYKAVHRQMQRVVALKVLSGSLRTDPGAQARFLREARAVAKLNHPNIVTAHDVSRERSITYLVMEYVEGQSLHEMITEQERLAPAQAADIAYQVARALQHAYEHGVVHRDIKPSNILINQRGTVKVLDMGIARIVHETTDPLETGTLTGDGVIVGTVDYVAPEQARDSHRADIRADIYSLGCTLYHSLTGQPPFPTGSATERLLKHQMDTPVPITVLSPAVPPDLAAVVDKMMAKDPDGRYQTPSAVAVALLPWAGPSALPAVPDLPGAEAGSPTTQTTPPPEPGALPDDGVPPTVALPAPEAPPAVSRPAKVDEPTAVRGDADARRPTGIWMRILVGVPSWAWGAAASALLVSLGVLIGAAIFAPRSTPPPAEPGQPARSPAPVVQTLPVKDLLSLALSSRTPPAKKTPSTEPPRKSVPAKAPPAGGPAAKTPPPPASAPPDNRARTLIVPEQYGTIQQALDLARAGDTVIVKPGVYRETLVFKSGVRLLGTDTGLCRIELAAGAGAILRATDCTAGSIENLTFDGHDMLPGREAPDGLVLDNAQVDVLACVAEKLPGSGIRVTGVRRAPSLRNNRCQLNGAHGILFENGAGGLAETNSLEQNKQAGIAVLDARTAPTLKNNQCLKNEGHGIAFEKGATGLGEGNTCADNKLSGIAVSEIGSAPTLGSNVCQRNGDHGIAFRNGAGGLAEDNTCEDNKKSGVAATGAGTAPTLRSNRCTGNWVHGIAFNDGARGTADRNTCAQNRVSGIVACDKNTSPTIENNQCRGNGMHGIYFGDGAEGTARANTCEQNRQAGIGAFSAGTRATVTTNQCKANEMYGVYFGQGAGGTAEDNTCEENKLAGLGVFQKGSTPVLRNNRARRNKQSGIFYGKGAGGLAEGNICEQNGVDGITLYDKGTNPLLRRNQCRRNEKWGIACSRGARPRIPATNIAADNKAGQIKR